MPGPSKANRTVEDTDQYDSELDVEDLADYKKFDRVLVKKKTLAKGGDGIVHLYEHPPSRVAIVVKVPRDGTSQTRANIMKEIENLEILGRHDHIVEMLTYCQNFKPIGPAIFLDHCDLGDLHSYRTHWGNQQQAKRKPAYPSEITIWKLLRDMILGLNFLHNGQEPRYVHNDLKPANILVTCPKNWNQADGIPEKPIFKITDFARLTPFPTPPGGKSCGWRGTPEFAPPFSEQKAPVRPSVDMWSLGASIQCFALDIWPIQSQQAFLESRKAQGRELPDLEDKKVWDSDHWRAQRPTVYRPLDVSADELRMSASHPVRVQAIQHRSQCPVHIIVARGLWRTCHVKDAGQVHRFDD